MKKRIITTVLTLCFVALALAGVASASRDIGHFTNTQVLSGNNVNFSTNRTKHYKNYAAINITKIEDLGTLSKGEDDQNDGKGNRILNPTYTIRYRVYNGDTAQTSYKTSGIGRTPHCYYQSKYRSTGSYYRLCLSNVNSFAVLTSGTWCPDSYEGSSIYATSSYPDNDATYALYVAACH